MATDTDHSLLDLRQMDREKARQTLPVAEFERWEKLHDLEDSAEQTRERFANEDQMVAELSITADTSELGTEVDLYGDTVTVYLDSEDEDVLEASERLDDIMGDLRPEDVPEMDDDEREAIGEALMDLLDAVFVAWNGTEWSDLNHATRRTHLERLRYDEWGLDAMFVALLDILAAISEDRQEKMDVIESFRSEERRGGRRSPR